MRELLVVHLLLLWPFVGWTVCLQDLVQLLCAIMQLDMRQVHQLGLCAYMHAKTCVGA